MSVLKAGKSAPHFGLIAIDGKKYSLQEGLKHGPVLAAFFKVACPTCQYTFPFLERLYQQLRSSGVQIWGISQDGVRDSQRFAREYSVTFPILIDDYPYKSRGNTDSNTSLRYSSSRRMVLSQSKARASRSGTFSKFKSRSLKRSPRQ